MFFSKKMIKIASCFVFMLINLSGKAADVIDQEAIKDGVAFHLKDYQFIIGENIFINGSDATDALGLRQKRGRISHNTIVKRIEALDQSIGFEELILRELRKAKEQLTRLGRQFKKEPIPSELYRPMVRAYLDPLGLKKAKKLGAAIRKRKQGIETSRSVLEKLEKLRQVTTSKVVENITVSKVVKYMKRQRSPLIQEDLKEHSTHALRELLG